MSTDVKWSMPVCWDHAVLRAMPPCSDPEHGHGGKCPGCGAEFPWGPSVYTSPNPYSSISTEPERPVTEEESQAIGRALVRSVKLIPNPYGGLTSNPDPAKFCAHGIPLIQSCRNCQGAKVAAACAVARGGR